MSYEEIGSAVLGPVGQIAGGILGNIASKKAAAREYAHQKEFAQSGIQWKVQDAEKAGIHPLYALGANTVSYSPQSVGGQDFSFLGSAGQNIGRAIDSTRSNSAKAEALALTASQLQLEGLQLDNEFKRAQLASAHALVRQGANPGLPDLSSTYGIPGQGDMERVSAAQRTPGLKYAGEMRPTNPGYSDAQVAQDRYGDWVEEVYGVGNLIADIEHNRHEYFNKNIRPYFKMGSDGRYRYEGPRPIPYKRW